MLVKVKDKESGREMSVTKKAYELRKHKYTFLGHTDDEGNDLPSPNQTPQPQVQPVQATEKERAAAPVVNEVVDKEKPGRKKQISSPAESAEV